MTGGDRWPSWPWIGFTCVWDTFLVVKLSTSSIHRNQQPQPGRVSSDFCYQLIWYYLIFKFVCLSVSQCIWYCKLGSESFCSLIFQWSSHFQYCVAQKLLHIFSWIHLTLGKDCTSLRGLKPPNCTEEDLNLNYSQLKIVSRKLTTGPLLVMAGFCSCEPFIIWTDWNQKYGCNCIFRQQMMFSVASEAFQTLAPVCRHYIGWLFVSWGGSVLPEHKKQGQSNVATCHLIITYLLELLSSNH